MKTGTFTVAAIIAAAVASHASAATVDVKFTGVGKGENVKLTYNGHSMGTVFAGQLMHKLSNAQSPYSSLNGNQVTFCTDLSEYVSSNTSQYEIVPVSSMPDSHYMGATKAAVLQKLYNGANGNQLTGSTSNDFAAAFQLAIWEIVTDYNANSGVSSINLDSGNFKAKKTNGHSLSGGIVTAFNTIIGYINHGYDSNVSLFGLRSDCNQDQIVQGPSVPAPASTVLAAMGLTLVAARRRTK